MINQYKRFDVFRCTHESHQDFGNVVSVYHVLREKECYPHGCVYFKWRCRLFDQRLPCPRSYRHVGRKCASCGEYYDEKVIKRPQLMLSPPDYERFLDELREFEQWLRMHKGKESNCIATITGVKPRFVVNHRYDRNRLSLQGFLLTFREGFIGLTHCEDTFYALVSPSLQGRLRLSRGDRIEFRGTLRLDRGRFILHHLRGIEVEERGEGDAWTIAGARQAQFRGTMYDQQYEKCIQCPYGALVDIQETALSPGNGSRRRKLLCLKGIENPEYCIVQASQRLFCADSCQSGEHLVS
ncbi:MAG: hypothetical protein ACMUIS_10695 [bacterium]